MSSPESVQVLDVDNALGAVSSVDEAVSEEVIECEDETTMELQESENGKQSRGGPGSAVYDLEYAVNMYVKCTPYPPIGDEVVLDEEYKCEEPEIVKRAQTLVISKWPEMHAVFSKCIALCMYWLLCAPNVIRFENRLSERGGCKIGMDFGYVEFCKNEVRRWSRQWSCHQKRWRFV